MKIKKNVKQKKKIKCVHAVKFDKMNNRFVVETTELSMKKMIDVYHVVVLPFTYYFGSLKGNSMTKVDREISLFSE